MTTVLKFEAVFVTSPHNLIHIILKDWDLQHFCAIFFAKLLCLKKELKKKMNSTFAVAPSLAYLMTSLSAMSTQIS